MKKKLNIIIHNHPFEKLCVFFDALCATAKNTGVHNIQKQNQI